jgi:HlyD family secretion protein
MEAGKPVAAQPSPLFRGAALKQLRSPEQIDQRARLIPAAMRAMAAATAIVLAAVLSWSVFGSIPTRVSGQGIMVDDGEGAYAVQPVTSGPILEILVKRGVQVAAGAIIARVEQASLTAQLSGATARATILQDHLARLKAAHAADIEKTEDTARRQQAAIDQQIAAGKARAARLTQVVADDEAMMAKGLVNRTQALNNRQQLDQTLLDVANAEARKVEVDANLAQKRDDLARREREKEAEIEGVQADIARLRTELTVGSAVKAPIGGVVEDVRVGRGDVVAPGTVIATIGQTGERKYEIVAVIGHDMAKRVLPGMDVHVRPMTVKKEQYGSMRGRVASITDRSVSTEELQAVLRNLELTKNLMGTSSPLLAHIDLFGDPNTESGFAWWTGDGPPFRVTRGTRVAVDVIVEETRPLALIMPALRKLLGVDG